MASEFAISIYELYVEYYYQRRSGERTRFLEFLSGSLDFHPIVRDTFRSNVQERKSKSEIQGSWLSKARRKDRNSVATQSDTDDAISEERSRKGACFLNGLLKCMVIGKFRDCGVFEKLSFFHSKKDSINNYLGRIRSSVQNNATYSFNVFLCL